jgi:hypothetical protein
MERHPSCLWSRRINIVKMTLLPRAVYSFNELPIKGLMDVQKTSESQSYANGGITISYLMSYYNNKKHGSGTKTDT